MVGPPSPSGPLWSEPVVRCLGGLSSGLVVAASHEVEPLVTRSLPRVAQVMGARILAFRIVTYGGPWTGTVGVDHGAALHLPLGGSPRGAAPDEAELQEWLSLALGSGRGSSGELVPHALPVPWVGPGQPSGAAKAAGVLVVAAPPGSPTAEELRAAAASWFSRILGAAARRRGERATGTVRTAAGAVQRPAGSRELWYGQILDTQHEMVCRFTTDMVVTYANRAYATQYGLDPDSIIGHSLLEFFPPEAHDWARTQVARMGPDVPIDRHENEVVFADGRRAWFSWTDIAILDDDGETVEIQAVGRDVTESHAMAEAVRSSEELLRHTFEDAPIGMAILSPDGRVHHANPALTRFLGTEDPDGAGSSLLRGRHVRDLVTEQDAGLLEPDARPAHDADRPLRREVRFRQAHGAPRWGLLSLSTLRGGGDHHGRMLLQVVDLEDRKRMEERLAHDAVHDPLTGLANRSLLLERLEGALRRYHDGETDGGLAVLFADIDDFKLVNDSLGHEVGDDLLGIVASRLAAAVRSQDTLARFGGDEFVVVAEQVRSRTEAHEVAQRLVGALADPVDLGVTEVAVSMSIGIAMAADRGTASRLIRSADAAMYHAKKGVRPRIAFSDDSLEFAAASRLSLQTDLDRALDREEFVVCYQPIIGADGRAVAAEALLRWNRGRQGMWTPTSFLGVAEDTGIMVPLGRHILGQACAQAARWSEAAGRPVQVWVNVGGPELVHPGYAAEVEEALTAYGLPPAQLCIELSEWTMLSDIDAVGAAVTRLKELGVGLALDDFGTGYSALDVVRQFPLDALKIDGSFSTTITDPTSTDRAIVTAVAGLGSALGLDVVAEGVESAGQATALRELGVPLLQGFALARPAVAEQIDQWFPACGSASLAS